jgi:hypothetical protein
MTAFNRWCLVAVGVVLLISVPIVVSARPAHDQTISAAALLAKVKAATAHAYSGDVETNGNLALPVDERFTDIGSLFGERNQLRVWWRTSREWRVDKVLSTGETDLIHYARSTTQWDYEQDAVRSGADPDIRLPRTSDLLPPALGTRLLENVRAGDLTRLPARRVAGLDALGLRLSPAAPQSSIDHVDLWADPATGVPVRVEVYAKGEQSPSFTSAFSTFDPATPTPATTGFTVPDGAHLSTTPLDIAAAANQFGRYEYATGQGFVSLLMPATLAGLAKAPHAGQGVGIYGTGVTQLIAIPLGGEARTLRQQLEGTPGVRTVNGCSMLRAGPLGLLLTNLPGRRDDWLISGTVTDKALTDAAAEFVIGASVQ